MMSIFSSLTQQYRSRLLTALRRGRRRRNGNNSPAPSEALEQRALLSSVTYNTVTENASFDADFGEENVVTISSPTSDTLVIQSQRIVAGDIVDDPITLQGNAVANSGFTLDATGSILTIDIALVGSQVNELAVNLFDSADQVNISSTPASAELVIDGGIDDDTVVVGVDTGGGFRMDDVRGDIFIDGGAGDDEIELLDFQSTRADTIDFRSSSVSGMSAGNIDYSNTENILVDTADLAVSTLNILSTSANVQSVVDLTFEDATGNPVRAIVTAGNTNADFGTTPGNMGNILGDIQLIANSGLVTLQIDDSGDTTGDTAIVGASTVSGFSPGSVSWTAGTQFSGIDVRAGSSNDNVTMTAAPTGIDLSAGDGDDVVSGSAFGDFIDAGLGDDTVSAGDGDDLILGFEGADVLDGEGGNDEISGENGADVLTGGLGDDSLDGGDGDDTLSGSAGDDTVFGGFGDDLADGDGGNDIMIGGEGNDTLRGDDGRDSITGGLGDDVLRGGSGRDEFRWNLTDGSDDVDGGGPAGVGSGGVDRQIVFGTIADEVFTIEDVNGSTLLTEAGGASLTVGVGIEELQVVASSGDDRITINDVSSGTIERVSAFGDAGEDRLDASNMVGAVAQLTGGRGHDVLFGSPNADTLRGGAGNDTMVGGAGVDEMKGASGRDEFLWSLGDGDDLIDGGQADDQIQITTGNAADSFVIDGDSDSTRIAITSASEVIDLVDMENVNINAFEGADSVTFGDMEVSTLKKISVDLAEGPDSFDASNMLASVSTRVLGGIGNDSLIGGPGADFLRGSSGDDTLRGGGGADELVGDGGDDSIAGGSGHDLLEGGAGDDYLGGREGDDTIQAGGGQDRIEGGDGDDFIGGGNGKDRIAAGAGNDIVNAGFGADIVTGGEGDDVLFGGRGTDKLSGNGGQDLMVSDRVSLSDSQLRQVRNIWLSGGSYNDRIDQLTEGDDALLLPLTSERTVRDDENADTMTGNAGRDLFFADFDTDLIDGRVPNEDQIDLR